MPHLPADGAVSAFLYLPTRLTATHPTSLKTGSPAVLGISGAHGVRKGLTTFAAEENRPQAVPGQRSAWPEGSPCWGSREEVSSKGEAGLGSCAAQGALEAEAGTEGPGRPPRDRGTCDHEPQGKVSHSRQTGILKS